MTEESDLTVSVGPDDAIAPVAQEEGQAENQTAESTPEGDGEEERKSEAAKRREREKAHKERLRQEADEARVAADRAEARRMKIIEAGKAEKPPAENEFTDYAEYVAAKAVWTTEQRTTQRQAEAFGEEAEAARRQAQAIAHQEEAMVNAQWNLQMQEAARRYADFEQVALYAPISDDVAKLIKVSDRGADVAYHLGQNKALAIEISRLPILEAARALGRLEATLSMPTPRTQSQTPEPIAPVRGRATAQPDPSKMSMEEYARWRRSKS